MSPKKTRLAPRDSFEDETTAQFVRDGIPVVVDDDEDTTMPVDVDEMQAVARASTRMPDPDSPPRLIRRGSSGEHKSGPYAEIRVAGTGELVSLPAHGISRTGVSLEVPEGVGLSLLEGATVMVHLHLADPSGSDAELRLRASVAHLRRARSGVKGGVSMRWDTSHEPTVEQIQTL